MELLGFSVAMPEIENNEKEPWNVRQKKFFYLKINM